MGAPGELTNPPRSDSGSSRQTQRRWQPWLKPAAGERHDDSPGMTFDLRDDGPALEPGTTDSPG